MASQNFRVEGGLSPTAKSLFIPKRRGFFYGGGAVMVLHKRKIITKKIIAIATACFFSCGAIGYVYPAGNAAPSGTHTLSPQSIFKPVLDENVRDSAELAFEVIAGVRLLLAGKNPATVNGLLTETYRNDPRGTKKQIEFLDTVTRSGRQVTAEFTLVGREGLRFEIVYDDTRTDAGSGDTSVEDTALQGAGLATLRYTHDIFQKNDRIVITKIAAPGKIADAGAGLKPQTRMITDLLEELNDRRSACCAELIAIYGAEDLERQRKRYLTMLERFRELYPQTERVVLSRAGGRVVLSGDKIDYHHGSVLNSALTQDILTIAGENHHSHRFNFNNMMAESFPPTVVSLRIENITFRKIPKKFLSWFSYCTAVLYELSSYIRKKGVVLPGIDMLVDGRPEYGGTPIGSGLSSSAAFTVSAGTAILGVVGMRDMVTAAELTDMCMAAEHRLGFPSGKQDFWGSLMGWLPGYVPGKEFAQIMDCTPRTGNDKRPKINSALVEMPPGYTAVVFRVAGPEETSEGRYKTNIRVAEGQLGAYLLSRSLRALVHERYPSFARNLDDAAALRRAYPDITGAENGSFPPYYKPTYFTIGALHTLGIPVTDRDLEGLIGRLPEEATRDLLVASSGIPGDIFERLSQPCRDVGLDMHTLRFHIRGTVRHAISEQERVMASVRALREKDMATFFRLQSETHRSLVENCGISPRLSMELIRILQGLGYVSASRLLGPGSGVNVLAWVKTDDRQTLINDVRRLFYKSYEPFSALPDAEIDRSIIPFRSGKGADILFRNDATAGQRETPTVQTTRESLSQAEARISNQHDDERILVRSADNYLRKRPVNMHVSLTAIPQDSLPEAIRTEHLERNMETLARLIAWHCASGLDVRYILEHDTDSAYRDLAQKLLHEKLEGLGNIPGVDASGLLRSIGPRHTGADVIAVMLTGRDAVKRMGDIPDRTYVVALKDDEKTTGLPMPSYAAAANIGLSLAALRCVRDTAEGFQAQGLGELSRKMMDEYEKLRRDTRDTFRKIYARYKIIFEEDDFAEEELELMVTGSSDTRLYYTLRYALPPIVKVALEELRRCYEIMHRVMQSA